MASRRTAFLALMIFMALVVSACNLSGAPSEEQIAQTSTADATGQPSRTPLSTSGVPTTVPVTRPTNLPTFAFPTSIVSIPTRVPPSNFPTSVPPPVIPTSSQPLNIAILSPVSGNVVAGGVQILGSATHPQFLQYQVEFGPDPNPGNLWFPVTSAITSPVLNGLLGIWNTNSVQDSRYQLRLRVYLRDGTLLTTVINNITVQNRVSTPVPSVTASIPRPIAAFTQDRASGDVPLTVQFTNQSSGTINTVAWNFGDGNLSNEINPRHTFGSPGLYTVTLTVNGPGGSSNVSRQINVTSPTAPVAGFIMDKTTGLAPLTVQFTDQSTGNVTSYQWFFSDGSTSALRNPSHTFTTPGTYNIFLTVSGPGGSSSVTRQITVTSLVSPTFTPSLTYTPTFTPSLTFTATFTPTNTSTGVPPTATFTPTFTETPTSTATGIPPTATFTETATVIPVSTDTPTNTTTAVPSTATETPTNTAIPPTATETPTNTAVPPTATPTNTEFPAPQANFTATADPNNPLAAQFTSTSSGQIAAYAWDFGDGTTSNEANPLHTYVSGGSYTVTLTVIDTLNRSSSFSGGVTVSEPINAGFTSSVSNLDAQFTNQTTGPVVSYAWDFGDGTTSNEQNPLHSYTTGGTYNVTLTVTSGDGRTDAETQQVSVSQPVQAEFASQVNSLNVQFANQSSGPVVAYAWDFGDGTTSNEQNPVHTYAAAGTYTVTLTVSDASSGTSSITHPVDVTAPVQANFSAQPNNLDVQFTDQSTGPVVGYAWDFGDGTTSNEQSPLHTYAAAGTYTVTLIVSDASSGTSSIAHPVDVTAPVQANFSAQPNNLDVQFTDQSTGPVVGYAWDFGDSTSSNEQSPLHTYAAAGTYTVTLTVSDASSGTSSITHPVDVTAPVQANFSAQPNNLDVQFTDQSTGPVVGYAWDFGDSTTSNEQSPLHTYAAAGTYTVTLTVSDAGGGSNSLSQQVSVSAPVQANFAPQPTNLDVQFIDQSTGPVAGYAWDFGDGSFSNEQSPLHSYATDGTYTVTLTVSDAGGGSNSTSQQVSVSSPVQAGFSAQPTDLNVQFTDQSTGTITQYAWDFGDGSFSNEQSPLHTYAAPGSYTVTLVVTASNGSSDDQSQAVDVTAALEANFTAQPTDLNVQFTDQSTGTVTGYSWNFGDGTNSTEQSPLHTYAAGGTYTVILTVSDANGRSDDFVSDVTVTAPAVPPTAPPQQSIVDTTPIQPDMNALQPFLRPIYANGINSMGTRATVFAVAGDSVFVESGILAPFATPGQYNLDANTDLQTIIDWFNTTDLSGFTSFNRGSLAIRPNWTAQDLLDPNQGDPTCNGEAPLPCELHQTLPVLMFVSIGSNDAANGTDPATFQNMLSQIVNTIVANGTIPVLMTVPDDGSTPNTVAINEAIIAVAQANNLPLLNVARALNELPSENLTAAPVGAGDLSADSVNNYGVNALNFRFLRVLSDARNIIFPDA